MFADSQPIYQHTHAHTQLQSENNKTGGSIAQQKKSLCNHVL